MRDSEAANVVSGAVEQGHIPGAVPSPPSARWLGTDGTEFTIRPIRPDDEPLMIEFHRELSERSVYMRYFESLSLAARTAHQRLAQICFADPERQTVLIALFHNPRTGKKQVVAVGRLSKMNDLKAAEVALLVADDFQGRGLGSELLRRLIAAAHKQQITRITGEMLRDNIGMQRLLKKFGFSSRLLDPRTVRAVLDLNLTQRPL